MISHVFHSPTSLEFGADSEVSTAYQLPRKQELLHLGGFGSEVLGCFFVSNATTVSKLFNIFFGLD